MCVCVCVIGCEEEQNNEHSKTYNMNHVPVSLQLPLWHWMELPPLVIVVVVVAVPPLSRCATLCAAPLRTWTCDASNDTFFLERTARIVFGRELAAPSLDYSLSSFGYIIFMTVYVYI